MTSVTLTGKEEAWQERFERLQERFPDLRGERVLQALRDNGGHAGRAASDLRESCSSVSKPIDPDDSEWVKTLLWNPTLFKNHCMSCFTKFDRNQNGTLEWTEVVELVREVSDELGLEEPKEQNLKKIFEKKDANHDGVLSETEFAEFFESYLRFFFFKDAGRQSPKDLLDFGAGLGASCDFSAGAMLGAVTPAGKVLTPSRSGTPGRLGTPTSRLGTPSLKTPSRTASMGALHGRSPMAANSPAGRRGSDVMRTLERRRDAQWGRSSRERRQLDCSGCQPIIDYRTDCGSGVLA